MSGVSVSDCRSEGCGFESRRDGDGLRGSPINAPTQGVLGGIMAWQRPDTPSAEQKKCLLISRSAIDTSERATAVVGRRPSGKSRAKELYHACTDAAGKGRADLPATFRRCHRNRTDGHQLKGRPYFSVGTTMPRMMIFWQKMNTRNVGIAASTKEA